MGNYHENFGSISQPQQFRRGKKGKNTMQMMLPQMEPKKKPRLTSDERKRIEKMLDDGWTPYKIAKAVFGGPWMQLKRYFFAMAENCGNRPNARRLMLRTDCIRTLSDWAISNLKWAESC